MAKADLHIHTTASDGNMKPEEVVRFSQKHKLEIISITDHDTIKGFLKAKPVADEAGITLLPGMEVTSDFHGRECHLLAYCFDPGHITVRKLIRDHYRARIERGKWIIDQLSKKGLDLDIEEVKAEANGGNVGRPHIAEVLVNKGYVASFKEAFIRHLSDQALGPIENDYYTHTEVIEMVKESGGAVVIAHPGKLYTETELESLVEAGVDGIEVIHPSHNYQIQKYVETFAARHNLLTTGGSDFHGGSTDYQKFFGVVTVNSMNARRLISMTERRKEITV